MTCLLHDSKGLTLDKCVSSNMLRRDSQVEKSCAWTEGMCTLQCRGLGVYLCKYSDEPQIKQDFCCFWCCADNEKQSSWMHRERGGGREEALGDAPAAVPSREPLQSFAPSPGAEEPELNVKPAQLSVNKTSTTGLGGFRLLIPNFDKD